MKNTNKNEVKDSILRRELKENEIDDDNLKKFLRLLERLKRSKELSNYKVITEDEQREVVKRSKKRSMLSIFSKRIYSVCKIMLESKEMIEVLIHFHNTTIKEDIVLESQKDMLDIMIEKGKEPILGKLRIIQLIEADLQLLI